MTISSQRTASCRLKELGAARTGFTLLEILIASLLVGIGIFAIVETFNRGYFSAGEVEDQTLALSLTEERLEQVKDTSFASVASSARAAVSGFSDFEQQVTVTTPQTNLKQVVVTTYWQIPGGEKSTSLTTYAANS